MAAGYPAALYQHTGPKRSRDVNLARWNAYGDEIAAIEATLGLAPHTGYADVAARLAAIEAASRLLQGAFVNLRVQNNATTPNSKIDIAADQMTIEGQLVSGVALTLDLSGSGLGKMDTGSISGSQWYYGWLIYNPTTATVNGIASLATDKGGLVLPAGYTLARRVSAHYAAAAVLRKQLQQDHWVTLPDNSETQTLTTTANGVAYANTPTLVPPVARLAKLTIEAAVNNQSILLRSGGSAVTDPYTYHTAAKQTANSSVFFSGFTIVLDAARSLYGKTSVGNMSTAIGVTDYYDPI